MFFFFCKKTGHRQFYCPAAKKKNEATYQGKLQHTVAATETSGSHDDVVAVHDVGGSGPQLVIDTLMVTVTGIAGIQCKLAAMIDTGSSVSFIRRDVLKNLKGLGDTEARQTSRKLRNLSGNPLNISGVVSVPVNIDLLKDSNWSVDLYILDEACEFEVILGREPFNKHKLILVCRPVNVDEIEQIDLYSALPLGLVEDAESKDNTESVIAGIETDFEERADEKFKKIVRAYCNNPVEQVEDGYAVEVRLKDNSAYAYAPRRFAFSERQEMRHIIDDLLKRDIIKPSVLPYCARVVLVRKKNGQLRLYVDLRLLNACVEKQKFPFPVIEECLSRLGNKNVFTLLD